MSISPTKAETTKSKSLAHQNNIDTRTFQLQDNRPEATAHQELQDMATNGPGIAQLREFQDMNKNFFGSPVQRGEDQNLTNGNESSPEADFMKPGALDTYSTDLDQMGVTAQAMSTDAYDSWKDTVQSKAAPHGSYSMNGQTIVTQFKNPDEVAQLFLSQKMKAGLVMAEGALTFIAGIVAIGVAGATGAAPVIVPAISAVVVGVVKFIRGVLMWGDDKPEGTKLAVIDALRAVEAAAAIVGASFLDPSLLFKIPMMIFGIAKAVRVLSTALADWLGEDTNHTIIRKGLLGLGTFAHALETAALLVASPAMIAEGGAKIAGGLATGAVGLSKEIRTADQSEAAADAPWAPSPQVPQVQGLTGNLSIDDDML